MIRALVATVFVAGLFGIIMASPFIVMLVGVCLGVFKNL